MDGVHDLGGREGFGSVPHKEDGKPFRAEWETRAFGIVQSSALGPGWSIDWFRHCRELIVPTDYLTRPYFDQWITTLAAQMVDEGYLTLDEVRSGQSSFIPQPAYPADTAEASRAYVKAPKSYAREVGTPPRFSPGDSVCCSPRGRPGHTRLPGYVRNRRGVVHSHHGGHLLPDASTRGETKAEHLYTVMFEAGELWPEAERATDQVFVDLWESYIESA
ncbi:nitrile hydratase subunit beta [Rhizobium sp. L9]|uniref:nitrile hydratase subunit beta n=1 Tax=Rhizobium TaxID=379 RepID=UPI000BE8756A|nr:MULTISPECIES: nitrile hydratase subunit beta [Rhizobium]MBX5153932.1 nitrile hydratase subunit beta [Rhizobium lentis]PDT25976.1 nitrile hydratase subunit beta [Rhizobium sp. L9]